ncbi:MAG: DUF6115 domain-containing protein [Lysinibacillus sp.]
MVSIILIVLFICQLLSFFFIILLNSKLARFKDLEARQEQIVREMDDAIGLYLMEMKEENDRLIKEITAVKQAPIRGQGNFEETDAKPHLTAGEDVVSREPEVTAESRKPYVPIAFAANAYSRHKQQESADKQPVQKAPESAAPVREQDEPSHLTPFEREVVEMHRAGKTIEEIAKKTQRGKTEIELLIKFHA